MNPDHITNETLDPQDWENFKAQAHDMLEYSFDYLKTVRERKPWTKIGSSQTIFTEELPQEGLGTEQVFSDVKEHIMPYTMGNIHPKFWAWYMGNGSPMGAMGDFVTSIINPNCGAGDHIGQYLEEQVIRWMCQCVDYPKDASGILVSGGSMANFTALSVARNDKMGFDVRKKGIRHADKQGIVYASSELHSSNQKAIELLGIGSDHLRKISVNDDYTIRLDALESAIKQDLELGNLPICIIANAGSVNTGAIDDLVALRRIADRYDLWLHIDGAIGAIANISPAIKPKLKGLQEADSITLDLHKWLHIPFEAGCVLIKDRKKHRDTFQLTPEYLAQNTRGLASGSNWFSEYGLQLSRSLRALKVWMCIKESGIKKFAQLIEQNVAQAQYLAHLVQRHPNLELLAPVVLDIVCFRYVDSALNDDQLNVLNKSILIELHERGMAIPSYTTLHNHYCLRVAIANHRSSVQDFEYLVRDVLQLAKELT